MQPTLTYEVLSYNETTGVYHKRFSFEVPGQVEIVGRWIFQKERVRFYGDLIVEARRKAAGCAGSRTTIIREVVFEAGVYCRKFVHTVFANGQWTDKLVFPVEDRVYDA